MATTEIGTVIAAATTAVLLLDCGVWLGAGVVVSLCIELGGAVTVEEEEEEDSTLLIVDDGNDEEVVSVGVVEVAEGIEVTEDAGEADLVVVPVALVALEVKLGLATTPSPRAQYPLKTSIADEACVGSCVQADETCPPIMVEYLG